MGNLEGSVIDEERSDENGVYNNYGAVVQLICHIPFKAFSLANNHLLDFSSVAESASHLQKIGISTIGVGNIDKESGSVIVIDEYNTAY